MAKWKDGQRNKEKKEKKVKTSIKAVNKSYKMKIHGERCRCFLSYAGEGMLCLAFHEVML